jgi:hypothetical protein
MFHGGLLAAPVPTHNCSDFIGENSNKWRHVVVEIIRTIICWPHPNVIFDINRLHRPLASILWFSISDTEAIHHQRGPKGVAH